MKAYPGREEGKRKERDRWPTGLARRGYVNNSGYKFDMLTLVD
jgi:hypothetical protein